MTAIKRIQNNLQKPDDPFWKKVGNQAIYVLAPVGTLLFTLFVPEPYKATVLAVWNTLCIALKGGTKFTAKT